MNLEQKICDAIEQECLKLISRYHEYHNALHLEHARKSKRTNNIDPKSIMIPTEWNQDKKFNPFYVKKNRKSIARSITKSIVEGNYKPKETYQKSIKKAEGTDRSIDVYQIPDSAISKLFYTSLLAKNKHRFSSFSYAYRNDRNVHFAIQDIWLDISRDSRSFIAEFDFSDFFGSISHDFLRSQFKQNEFSVSDQERQIIDAFLKGRDKGIPQGTSISLFLANIVCWQLDLGLEREGVKFARYADDTIIWSPDYDKICRAFAVINKFSLSTDIKINLKKSDGISLLTASGLPSEFNNTKTKIDFLGYSLSVKEISIKALSINKIKKQISYILYQNLIQPLKGSTLKALIIPSNQSDPALITAMMQIRRYLYGGLTTRQLLDYINGRSSHIFFKGIMSFYPLVNDEVQLKNLDGWILSIIFRSIRLRSKLLKHWGYDRSMSFPFNISKENIVREFRSKKYKGKTLLEIPSFMLIQKALERGVENLGVEAVMNPKSNSYDY
jgi:RNA-directed DNA polymerase